MWRHYCLPFLNKGLTKCSRNLKRFFRWFSTLGEKKWKKFCSCLRPKTKKTFFLHSPKFLTILFPEKAVFAKIRNHSTSKKSEALNFDLKFSLIFSVICKRAAWNTHIVDKLVQNFNTILIKRPLWSLI